MVLLTGPEIWLAIAIWAIGAACGMAWTWILWGIDKKRDEDKK